MTGLYIHVPFCLRKCPYCDFYSIPFDSGLADRYTDTVCTLLKSKRFPAKSFGTVYFGGGTPSLLTARQVSNILEAAAEAYGIADGAEITLELNPATSPPGYLRELRGCGVNRLSVGVQSAVDSELSALGRLHSAEDSKTAIESALNAGFDNVSADLMLAIPGQNEYTLTRSAEFLAGMPVSHVSAYILKVEENTEFFRHGIEPGNDDFCADLYMLAAELLEGHGFCQYEVSSFAKTGCEARHNLNYWKLGEYLGLGPAAHSFLGGRRFSFSCDLGLFLTDPISQLIEEGPGGDAGEFVMLSLRLSEGLDLSAFERRYKTDCTVLLRRAEPFIKAELAKLENGRLFLAPEGFLLSNTIIAELLAL